MLFKLKLAGSRIPPEFGLRQHLALRALNQHQRLIKQYFASLGEVLQIRNATDHLP